MSVRETPQIDSAAGKLGVLLPGLGAVSTTFIAGVEMIRKGLTPPIGSLSQMSRIRLGKRTENRNPLIREFVPLAGLDQLVFGGWDIYEDNCYEAALKAGVLSPEHRETVRPLLESIAPMKAVFEQRYVQRINGPNVKQGKNKRELAEALIQDIADFKAANGCDRCVMVWCGSTEIFQKAGDVHSSLEKFEAGLEASDPDIAPSQIYAYAALKSGVPFANGAPNLTVDTPALQELAKLNKLPIAGKDYKSGQTFMKTLLAPGLKARMLGLSGWFSGNILGNRDGEVLDEPANFKTKEDSKLSALDVIFQPKFYPELYKDYFHKVRIEYYPPRGDNKEGWDNIDIFGWMGYPMQIKVNFLCRDSILAAPLVLDLALFMDLANRAGMSGIQEWLSFYFKSPMAAKEIYPEHDIFIQLMKMKNTLRWMKGEEMITHLGLEYYD
ncbi:MAG: inositol-3-phosphate synthase [Acidobacteria bacterium]|nr:inositol-3-phosphate synthase [Acidobacteriota bacterium]